MVAGIDRFREHFAAHEDVDQTASDSSLKPAAFRVPFSRDDAVNVLREVYRLT